MELESAQKRRAPNKTRSTVLEAISAGISEPAPMSMASFKPVVPHAAV